LNVDPDAIKAAAHLIIKERGHPERHRAIVDTLDDDTAVALCIWLRDPENASGLLGGGPNRTRTERRAKPNRPPKREARQRIAAPAQANRTERRSNRAAREGGGSAVGTPPALSGASSRGAP